MISNSLIGGDGGEGGDNDGSGGNGGTGLYFGASGARKLTINGAILGGDGGTKGSKRNSRWQWRRRHQRDR